MAGKKGTGKRGRRRKNRRMAGKTGTGKRGRRKKERRKGWQRKRVLESEGEG
jgi:hypothetical protein